MSKPENDNKGSLTYGSFEASGPHARKAAEQVGELYSRISVLSSQQKSSSCSVSIHSDGPKDNSVDGTLDGIDSDEVVDSSPPRTLGVFQLAGLMYLVTAGGGYGLEPVVQAAGPFPALIGLLIVPWVWSAPQALMTAELSTDRKSVV